LVVILHVASKTICNGMGHVCGAVLLTPATTISCFQPDLLLLELGRLPTFT